MPEQCETMPDIRSEIDQLDRAIVDLLTKRLKYIERAAHLKALRDTVRDEDRVRDVLAKVRAHARALDGDEKMVEVIYRLLIEYSIIYELEIFDLKDG